MSEPIEFYFDFSSPYGYLMAEKIDAVAERYGRVVRWHPILLGIIFQANGVRPPVDGASAKSRYMLRDFERSARFMGVPYEAPSRFPLATQNAARAYYWLEGSNPGQARAFARAVYRAFFVEDRDISSPEVVLDVGASLGIARAELAEAMKSQAMKERLKAETDAAIEKGVFGSPHVVIDGEPFFGADRLPQIERWLESGGF